MKYFKSIFNNKPDQSTKCTTHFYSTIYDSTSPSVHLDDIKAIIKDEQKRTYFFLKNPSSILEEVKMLYTIHMMMIADQIYDIEAVNHCLQSGRIVYKSKTENENNHLQTYQQTYTQQQSQYNNSLYLNSSEVLAIQFQHPSIATDQLESDLTNLYYSYLQRAANNYDIYQSCQRMQYPYLDETGNRRVQYLWLFKIVNLLNFKIAMIPFIQKALFHASSLFVYHKNNQGIAKDVSILILKDCINEYMFVKKELEEQIGYYSQFNVKDALSFYELYLQLKYITDRLKLFHNLRTSFIKHEKLKEFTWFGLEKKGECEIEAYIQKAKLINSSQFKQSLQVPTQKAAYEHLQQQLMSLPKTDKGFYKIKKKDIKQLLSPESQKKKQDSKVNTHRILCNQ